MNFFKCLAVLSMVFGLTSAGSYHHEHGHHGNDGGVAVHYSVVTEHKAEHQAHEGDHGHDDAYGGHDDGHAIVHTWNYDAGHSAGGHYDAGHGGDGHGDDQHHDHHAYPKYDFSYGIKDPKTGDIKSQKETRDGSTVKGSYTVKEADGTTRHVEYTADKHKGFNAVVHTTGHAHGGAHAAEHGHGGHGYESHDHGHGQASSFIIVKKQEEKKH